MVVHAVLIGLGGLLAGGSPWPSDVPFACAGPDPASPVYENPGSPDYYSFELVPTRRVPGTARSKGLGEVNFVSSPFGVSVGADGSYRYDIRVSVEGLRPPPRGVYVTWLMTPELDHVVRLGAVDVDSPVTGRVTWNKFIVAVTLEEADEPDATTWFGPVVMRGVSRSGLMHTMAGHGPFEQELCAKYGYGN